MRDRPETRTAISSAKDVYAGVAPTAPCTAPQPFWLSGRCPTWCTETHHDSDFYDDRVHLLLRPGAPIALSLHETRRVPEQAAPQRAGGAVKTAESSPAHMDVMALWHYRHAEPEIELVVPKFGEKGHPDGEADVRLTVAEASALRDALAQVIVTLRTSNPAVLNAPEPGVDEPNFSDRQQVVIVESAGECASLRSELAWWPDEGPSVQINVMDIPVICNLKEAHDAASRLRAFADVVEAHAAQVEALHVIQ